MLFLRKYILAAIALALFYSQTLISSSLADSPEFRRVEISGGINATTLYVNQDGNRWTQILGYEAIIPVHVNIEMSKGYIEFYRIGRNLTDGAVRDILLTHYNNNSGTPYERDVDSSTSVNKTTNVPVGGGVRLNPTDEQAIVGRCNSKLAEISSGHHFSYVIPLALHADAKRRRRLNTPFDITYDGGAYRGYGDSARATATGTVSVRIECLKNEVTRDTAPPSTPPNDGEPRSGNDDNNIPKPPANQDLGFDQGPMKVKDIRLTFTTFQNGYTEPTPGTRCKKARLRDRKSVV